MGCLFVLLAAISPRLVLVLLWIFNTNLASRAFNGSVIPLFGFLFLPFTTLVYIFVYNPVTGQLSGWGLFWVLLAILIDLGNYGNTYSNRNSISNRAN